jgi:hypothetical protein
MTSSQLERYQPGIRWDGDEPENPDGDGRQQVSVPLRLAYLGVILVLLSIGWYVDTRAEGEREKALEAISQYAGDAYTDDFDRGLPSDIFLGPRTGDEGFNWSTLGQGGWVAAADGVARVGNGPEGNSLALLDAGQPDYAVVTTAVNATNGSGLVFRYQDVNNHWAILAAPDFATWNIVRYEFGAEVYRESVGLRPVSPGTRIGVSVLGPSVRVFIDGIEVWAQPNEAFRASTIIGLVGPNSSGAAYDDFTLLTDARAIVPGGAANG